jgi:hypothetical protein
MKFILIITTLSLLLIGCSEQDINFSHQIAGTWTRQTSFNMRTFSWTNPVTFTATFSSGGSFTESLGHRDSLVTYQGAWLVKEGELVMTVTNAQGTGNHQAGPVGSVDRGRIIRVDEHELIYETDGHTNVWSR